MASAMPTEKSFRAVHRGAPISPRKARYVLDLVRGRSVNDALDVLKHSSKRAAPMLTKVLMSALASAQLDDSVDHNALHVVDIRADDGPRRRSWKHRSRGQIFPLILRHAHLTVVLAERQAKEGRRAGKVADKSRRARVEASRRAQEKAGSSPAGSEENA